MGYPAPSRFANGLEYAIAVNVGNVVFHVTWIVVSEII